MKLADHQPGAGHQRERQRNLGGDQDRPPALPFQTALLRRIDEVGARHLQCRRDAEAEAGQ